MGAVESASRALRALSRHPAIFLAAAAFGLLKVPIEFTGTLHLSYVYWLLALLAFPVTPLLLSALYGVSNAALARDRRSEQATDGGFGEATDGGFAGYSPPGGPALKDAWTGIKEGYASLLLANVLYATVHHVLLFTFTALWLSAAFVMLIFAGIALELGEGTLAGDLALFLSLLVLLAFAAVYVLVRFGLAFLFQLYRPAAVVGDCGPLEAFVESARLVRDNPRSTAGFVLIRAFVFVVLLMPGAIALIAFLLIEIAVFEAPGEGGVAHLLVGLAVLVYGLGVAQLAVLGTYRVAFYRELADESTHTESTTAPHRSVSATAPHRPASATTPHEPQTTNRIPSVRPAGRNTRTPHDGRTPHDERTPRDPRTTRNDQQSPEVTEDESGADGESDTEDESGFVFGQPLEPASGNEAGDEHDE